MKWPYVIRVTRGLQLGRNTAGAYFCAVNVPRGAVLVRRTTLLAAVWCALKLKWSGSC